MKTGAVGGRVSERERDAIAPPSPLPCLHDGLTIEARRWGCGRWQAAQACFLFPSEILSGRQKPASPLLSRIGDTNGPRILRRSEERRRRRRNRAPNTAVHLPPSLFLVLSGPSVFYGTLLSPLIYYVYVSQERLPPFFSSSYRSRVYTACSRDDDF